MSIPQFNTEKDTFEDIKHQLRHLKKIGVSDTKIDAYALGITLLAIKRKQVIIGQPELPIEMQEATPW